MAKTFTNRAKYRASTTGWSGVPFRLIALKGSTPSSATIEDMNVLSDLLGVMTEAAAAGYGRANTSYTFSEDDTNNQSTMLLAATTFGTVALGETWTAIACFDRTNAPTDSACELYWVDVLSAPYATVGNIPQYIATDRVV